MLHKILSIVSLVGGLIITSIDGPTGIKEDSKLDLTWTVQYQLPQELKDKIAQQSIQSVSAHFAKTYEVSGNQLRLNFSDLEFHKSTGGKTLQKKADEILGKTFDINCSSNEVRLGDGAAVAPELETILVAECGNVKRDESIRQFLQSLSQSAHVANTEIVFPSGQNLVSSSQGPKLSVVRLVVQQDTAIGEEPLKVSCQAEMTFTSANNSIQKEPLQGEINIYPSSKRIAATLQSTRTDQTSFPDGTKIPTTITIKFTSAETF